jgi:hypothetical protein
VPTAVGRRPGGEAFGRPRTPPSPHPPPDSLRAGLRRPRPRGSAALGRRSRRGRLSDGQLTRHDSSPEPTVVSTASSLSAFANAADVSHRSSISSRYDRAVPSVTSSRFAMPDELYPSSDHDTARANRSRTPYSCAMYCDRRSTHRDGSRRCRGAVTAAPHTQRHTQTRYRTESAASRRHRKTVGDGRRTTGHGTTSRQDVASPRGTVGAVPLGRAPASSGADPSSISRWCLVRTTQSFRPTLRRCGAICYVSQHHY